MAESGPRDTKVLKGLGAAIGLLVLGGMVLRATAPEPERVAAAGQDSAAIAVRTLRLEPELRSAQVRVSGVVEPKRSVRLSSETSGRVLELGAEELDRVEEGQLLVRVDPLTARVALQRAEAAVERTRSELGLARTNLERLESLAERDVASDSALDDARNRSRVARAAVSEALANLEQARDELEKKTIRAPFDGVLRRFQLEGSEVVGVGQELGELLDLSAARISVGLSDRQIVGVSAGARVAVDVEAYPGELFEGRVLRVGAATDPETRKFPLEVEVDNHDGRLLPGMVARVQLEVGDEVARLRVPREAVSEEFDVHFVFAVEPDAKGVVRAVRRRVEVAEIPFEPAFLELRSGVQAGDEIAVTGVRSLRDGTPVRQKALAEGGAPTAAGPS